MLNVWAFTVASIWESINIWFENTFKFDEVLDTLVDFIKSYPDVIKWGVSLFLIIIIVLGIISFIKKTFKLFIVLLIIGVIILVVLRAK